jgi:hypothetical protein
MTDFSPQTPSDHPIPAYLASLVRQGMAGGIGYLVGKGIIPADLGGELLAAGMALLPVLWGLYTQHSSAKKLNAANAR